jgi:hypothetical protein
LKKRWSGNATAVVKRTSRVDGSTAKGESLKTQRQGLANGLVFSIIAILLSSSISAADPISLSAFLQSLDDIQVSTQGANHPEAAAPIFASLHDFVDSEGPEGYSVSSETRGPSTDKLFDLLPRGPARLTTADFNGPAGFADVGETEKVAQSREGAEIGANGRGGAGKSENSDSRAAIRADLERVGTGGIQTRRMNKPLTRGQVMMLRTANPFAVSLGTGLDAAGQITNSLKAVAVAVRPIDLVGAGTSPVGQSLSHSNYVEWGAKQNLAEKTWQMCKDNPLLTLLSVIAVLFVLRAVLA